MDKYKEEIETFYQYIVDQPKFVNKITNVKFLVAFLHTHPEFEEYLTDENIKKFARALDPIGNNIGPSSDEKLMFAHINLGQEYYRLEGMLAVISYLFQCEKEWGSDDTDMYVKKKKDEKIKKEQKIIKKFLNHNFKYNPHRHIMECFTKYKDQELTKEKRKFVSVDLEKLGMPMPPADLFAQFRRFADFYHNEISGLTYELFGLEESVLEFAIRPYLWTSSDEEIDKFYDTYGDMILHKVDVIPTNRWTMIGPWRENKENVKINVNERDKRHIDPNRILESMNSQDIYNKILARKAKKKREESGADPDLIKKYNESMGVSDILEEAMNDDEEDVENLYEYPVIHIDAKTGEEKKGKLYFENRFTLENKDAS